MIYKKFLLVRNFTNYQHIHKVNIRFPQYYPRYSTKLYKYPISHNPFPSKPKLGDLITRITQDICHSTGVSNQYFRASPARVTATRRKTIQILMLYSGFEIRKTAVY